MKRTKNINLDNLRKVPRAYALKPLSLAVATATIAGCGNQREAVVYTGLEDCQINNPEDVNQCNAAYQTALKNAQETSPKYRSEYDCEYDFGANGCVPYRNNAGNSWFMPAMAGFMIARALDNRYSYAPMFTSYSRRSPYYGRWTSADGNIYSSNQHRRIRVSDSAFKPKPKVTRTISRGGFGSTASAKSKWGTSSRGGWGG